MEVNIKNMKKLEKKLIILESVVLIIIGISLIGHFKTSREDFKEETTKYTTTTQTTLTTLKNDVKTTKKKTTKKKVVKKVATASYSEYQQYAQSYGGYDATQMSALINLWNRESGWNPNARNKKSGACGIPQALPCNKIAKQQGSNDWKAQIRWGINYIKNRYGTPANAWKHFKNKGWY